MKYFNEILHEIKKFKKVNAKEKAYLIKKYGKDELEEFLAIYYSKTTKEKELEEYLNNETNIELKEENLEQLYLNEIRKYRVLTKEEELSHFKVLEKYRNYIKDNNINYDTLTKEINKELKNITLDDTNTDIVINKITNSSIPESSKQVLINKIKIYELYQKSYNIIFNHNLRLVTFVAFKHQNKGIDILDLIQEGNIGLIKAIDKYETQYNTRFSTYAVFWIKQKITRKLESEGKTIKIPSHIAYKLSIYEKIYQELEANEKDLSFENLYDAYVTYFAKKKCQNNTEEELLKHKKETMKIITEEEFIKIMQAFDMNNITSLDERIKKNNQEDEETTILDFIPSENEEMETKIVEDELFSIIKKILSREKITLKKESIRVFSITDKIVLSLRFNMNIKDFVTLEEINKLIKETKNKINPEELLKIYNNQLPKVYKLDEIGKVLGLTRERIRKIEEIALLKIRTIISREYKEFFEEYTYKKIL